MVKGLLHQNGIEKFWQQWILRQMGIQTSQSENSTTVLLSHAPKQNSKVSHTASTQATHSRASGPGNVKSTKLSPESGRSQSPSLTSALGLAKHYKRPQSQLFNFIQPENVKENTSTARYSARKTSASTKSLASSSFQSSATTNISFQNYTHRLPAVRMARTKQTARKSRDDRHRDDERRQDGDRRRDRSNPRQEEVGVGRHYPQNMCACFVGKSAINERTIDVIFLRYITVVLTAPQLQPLILHRQRNGVPVSQPAKQQDKGPIW